ncbi:hypothetical protein [Pseudomonas sp. EMN2]|uniref:hypothetical protein n=1 Tax=Pseudomonas sp. EMN2 TaxID=2615212 RepID=UPI0021156041|nr:hypothetical protein [Pseudomonas sp. EMN2]
MKGTIQGLLIAGAALVIAGCAALPQYQMVKKGVTPEERTQDDAHCQMQASYIQTADWEFQGTFMEGANIQQKRQKTYGYCMSSKGYSSVRVQ